MAANAERISPARMIVTALGALLATGVASAIWGGLLMVNLSTTPALPWSALIHAAGLAAFFGWIWPNDAARVLGSQALHETWFWVHVAQIVVFAGASIVGYRRLAATGPGRQQGA